GHRERNVALRAAGRLGEVDVDLGPDVGATRAPGTARDAEEIVPEERGEEIGQAAEIEGRRREAAAAQAGVAIAVVELAGLGLGENLVRLDHLAEPLLRVRLLRDIRVERARQPPERFLDLRLVRRALQA